MSDTLIQTLMYRLRGMYPDLELSLDAPTNLGGEWFLDLTTLSRKIVIQWHPSKGFGLSPADGSYGEGPSEVYGSIDAVCGRVVSILAEEMDQDRPHQELETLILGALRKKFGLSQDELAKVLGAKQSTVSVLERTSDPQFSSIRKFVEALGGQVRIVADFGDQSFNLQIGD